MARRHIGAVTQDRPAEVTEESEDDLQIRVVSMLRKRKLRTVWFHVPNGGWRNPATAAKLRRMGVRPGVADFIFLDRRYMWPACGLAIEMKNRKGRQSQDQIDFQDAWEAMGGRYYIARSVEEVERIIEGME